MHSAATCMAQEGRCSGDGVALGLHERGHRRGEGREEGERTWESEGEKSGGSPSAYHCAWRRRFTRGMKRLKICNVKPA